MNNKSSADQSFNTKTAHLSDTSDIPENFNPIIGQPYNIDKVTLQQIDNLTISYIFTTGRSASTLLGLMLMMSDEVVLAGEEIFPIALQQKYKFIKKWTEQTIRAYCDDFVLMSEGMLYPLFAGKEVLYQLLMPFKEHLNYERVIRLSYLSFGINKDLSKITTIVDKQLRYYLAQNYLSLFPNAKVILLVRDPRDNVYSKYKRAERRGLIKNTCLYIHTWKAAFSTYFKVLRNHQKSFLIVNYEQLINNSEHTMQQIAHYLSVLYTPKFFEHYVVANTFFQNITHSKLKEHFIITHKSLTLPISPQKVNEWKNQMHHSEVAYLINATWTRTHTLAQKLNYQPHENFKPQNFFCLKIQIKIFLNFITSIIYFHFLPYKLKRYIKEKKYPYRKTAPSSFDRFLRTSYL